MNEDELKNNDEQQEPEPKGRPAGVSEGSGAEPSASEIAELYKATGVKAPVPTDKSKKRPSADDGGNKKAPKQDDASGKSEKGRASDDGANKPKASSDSDSDGANGDDADAKSPKSSPKKGSDGQEDGKVSDSGEENESGVQEDEPRDNKKTGKSSEDSGDEGASGAGEGEGESESEEEKGKRPGKSNPKIEQRIQKLTTESKAKDDRIEELENKLRENTRKQAEEKVAAEDPEYTLQDFKKVVDEKGEVFELDDNQAELAYRRWKDGYDQRKSVRQAEINRQESVSKAAEEYQREQMQKSVEAYDSLTSLLDEYPELDVRNEEKFDEDFSNDVMPLIRELVIYEEGTEPTEENKAKGVKPVVAGMKFDPKILLGVIDKIRNKKRSLPLNGTDDNVESRSDVSVPHSRSSDPTVNQANELMKTLKIAKRF